MMDPQRDKTMVADLLSFKEKMDITVDESFRRGEKFVNSLKVCLRFSLIVHNFFS